MGASELDLIFRDICGDRGYSINSDHLAELRERYKRVPESGDIWLDCERVVIAWENEM